jgi:hypothetical protein
MLPLVIVAAKDRVQIMREIETDLGQVAGCEWFGVQVQAKDGLRLNL